MEKATLRGLIIRLAVTFIQGFFAVWSTSGFATDKVALGGGVAAGISLVYNLFVQPYINESKKIKGA